MLFNNILLITNTIFCDPLGQFEISNIFSTPCVHEYNWPEYTTFFAWILTFLTKIFSPFFGTQPNFNSILDLGSFFSTYINLQIQYFYYNLFIGFSLFPFFVIEPNTFFLNFIQDSYYKLIANAYLIPKFQTINLLRPALLSDMFSFFNIELSEIPAYKYTPLHYVFLNTLTFQDFFFNYFVQDLFLSQILISGQVHAFQTLNIFGLLLNQQTAQGHSLTLLNSILSVPNATLLYKSLNLYNNDNNFKNALYQFSDLTAFNRLFGVGITELAALSLNNTTNVTTNTNIIDITAQELAFITGCKLYMIFCADAFTGLVRLWNNFGSVFNLINPSILSSSSKCALVATKPFDTFSSDFIYNLGSASRNYFLTLRLLTTYHTLFWPEASLIIKDDIMNCSNSIIYTLVTSKHSDISPSAVQAALASNNFYIEISKLFEISENLRFTQVLDYAKIVYHIDKLLAIQKHNYNDVAILNLKRLPADLNFISSSKYKYNFMFWCFFQLKHNGLSFFENYEKNNNCSTNSCQITPVLGYNESLQNLLAGAKQFDKYPLNFHAFNIADMVCVDVIDSDNLAELDFSQSILFKDLWNTDSSVKYTIATAFSLCLDTLESFYLSAESPLAAEYYTDILFNFMAYIVRGVVLNKNPELFFNLPSYCNTDDSSSTYLPINISIKKQTLADILRPLLDIFNNEYFGYTRFVTIEDLIIYLLHSENALTFNAFIETYGINIFSEFLICVKNLWYFAGSASEFKLDSALNPVYSFDSELTPKLELSLRNLLKKYLDIHIPEEDRNIIGPFSYFSIVLQQYPYIGLSGEQYGFVKIKHDFDISRYELFFNYFAEDNVQTAKLREHLVNVFIDTYTSVLDGGLDNITANFGALDGYAFKCEGNAYHYLSDVAGNLLFYKIGYYVFDEFFLSILVGLFCNNQSVFIAFSVLVLSILFFIIPFLNNIKLIPLNWQYVMENLYKFILNILNAQVGKIAAKFFPYVFSIFCIILVANIAGMTLFAFTLTSHILVTFTLGVSSFFGLTILGFYVQKLAFFNLFLPKGIPTALIPILLVVEVISYVSRALSLSIRLFANLMSGHTLLHILAFFSSKLFKFKYIVGLLSFLLILAIVVLEFCIAMLQAYVFAILICIYLNDSFHGGH